MKSKGSRLVLADPSGRLPASRPMSFLTIFPSIMLPMFLAMIDQTIVAAALPTIAAELGEVKQVSWVVVFYLMATAASAPVSGRLADALGRRKLMIIALIVSMIGSVLCALSTSLEMLVASRVLQGLGGGGLMALSQALLGQSVAPRERARFQGYIAAVAITASALGPVIGGFMTNYFGWRTIFLINLPLGTLAILLVMKLPEPRASREPLHFDWLGLVLFNLVVWTLLGFVNEMRQPLIANMLLAIGLALGLLVAVGLLVWRETCAPSPLLPIPLLRNPSIWRSNALTMCHGALMVSLITFTPFYLRAVHNATAAEIGLLMLPMTMGVGIGSVITSQIVSRTGRTAILPSVGLMMVTGMLIHLCFNIPSMDALRVAWQLGVTSIFLGTVMGVVHVTVMSEASIKLLGTVSGAVQLSRSLGAAMGTTLVGVVLFTSAGQEEAGNLQAALQTVALPGATTIDRPDAEHLHGVLVEAFRYVFFTIAMFGLCASILAWTIPRRKI